MTKVLLKGDMVIVAPMNEITTEKESPFTNVTVGSKTHFTAEFPNGISHEKLLEIIEQAEAFLEKYKPLVCDK